MKAVVNIGGTQAPVPQMAKEPLQKKESVGVVETEKDIFEITTRNAAGKKYTFSYRVERDNEGKIFASSWIPKELPDFIWKDGHSQT